MITNIHALSLSFVRIESFFIKKIASAYTTSVAFLLFTDRSMAYIYTTTKIHTSPYIRRSGIKKHLQSGEERNV